jgi:hypothetical protein
VSSIVFFSPPARLPVQYTSRCQGILQGLFDYLKAARPNATIVVKRGGDLFLDYARLAFSKVRPLLPGRYLAPH